MCLRAEQGAVIADKTVLKMMREMGIGCGIRRETDYHKYNSHKGVVGETFENVIGGDFAADGPWEKMGTDVTESRQPWGKACFAPACDFGSKEIIARSTSLHPNMTQQVELLDQMLSKKPEGSSPILHSDMGWQYQQAGVVQKAGGGRDRSEHVQEGRPHQQRRDGAGIRPPERRVLPEPDVAELRRVQARPRCIHRPLGHEEAPG